VTDRTDKMRGALASRADAISAVRVPGVVALRDSGFFGQIDLRGDPADSSFLAEVRQVLGLDLPTNANTVAVSGDRAALWLSPDEWLIVVPFATRAQTIDDLKRALAGKHVSITDVSSNRTILELSGSKSREVLAKGCGLDLHPRAFKAGQCAQTVVARSQAVIWQMDETPTYRVLVRPSFAAYLTDFFIDAMKEYALNPISR
jgi:sarcosine oxidase subunit gamma